MQLEKVKEFRAARNIPQVVLGEEDCLPQSEESFQGKPIVVRSSSLAPEYRTADCQLGFAISGFGCTPGSRGRAVFFQELYSGERCRWDASDILGVCSCWPAPWRSAREMSDSTHRRVRPQAALRHSKSRWADIRTFTQLIPTPA